MPKSKEAKSAANKRAYEKKKMKLQSNPELLQESREKRRKSQGLYRQRHKGDASAVPQPGSSSPPSPDPSSHPSRSLDFVSSVRGVQVHQNASVIECPGGLKTIAPGPILIRENANYLSVDETYVRNVASHPAAKPGTPFVGFLNPNSPDLVSEIRHSLSLDRPIVIRDFEMSSSSTLTKDDAEVAGPSSYLGRRRRMSTDDDRDDDVFPPPPSPPTRGVSTTDDVVVTRPQKRARVEVADTNEDQPEVVEPAPQLSGFEFIKETSKQILVTFIKAGTEFFKY